MPGKDDAVTRRRLFGALWVCWLGAFVLLELAALATCEGDVGATGCTLSAVWWRATADPLVWVLGTVALVILGAHLASRGRF